MVEVTEALRTECEAEWDHLLNKTFSTPMAVEHLAQFVASKQLAALEEAAKVADTHAAQGGGMITPAGVMAGHRIAQAIRDLANKGKDQPHD